MLFFINIDHSSNKFPPIPGYKSATIWCLLDNDESGHVNVCEHRAPRLPLLPSFKTCSPPRSPKIFSFLSPNFLKILYSGIFFSNSTANDSVHLQYFSFPATTFSREGLFTKMVRVKPQRRVFAFRSKPSRYDRQETRAGDHHEGCVLILINQKKRELLGSATSFYQDWQSQ